MEGSNKEREKKVSHHSIFDDFLDLRLFPLNV